MGFRDLGVRGEGGGQSLFFGSSVFVLWILQAYTCTCTMLMKLIIDENQLMMLSWSCDHQLVKINIDIILIGIDFY